MDKFERYREIMQTNVDGINGTLKFIIQIIIDLEERVEALEDGSRKVTTNEENNIHS